MSKNRARSFSRDFKLRAAQRLEAGESGSALALELTVKREVLYRWRDAYLRGGEEALRDRFGRPTKAEALALAAARGVAAKASDLSQARRQIAELERKVGQQALDLDFFKQALRHVEASRRPISGPGGTASSPASKR